MLAKVGRLPATDLARLAGFDGTAPRPPQRPRPAVEAGAAPERQSRNESNHLTITTP
ncbi:hypothetical protein WCLP8_2700005 [uncultured Gammaproteobacteria bacterium]